MMNITTTALGLMLFLTGIIGFFTRDFMGMDLSPVHIVFLMAVGTATVYFGLQGTEFQARYVCRFLGVMFGLLGAITLFSASGVATAGGVDIPSDHVLKVIPGHLEYTTADGLRNIVFGIIGLVAGFFPRQKEIEIDMQVQKTKAKVLSGR